MPPPRPIVLLPLTVLRVKESVPVLKIPPPPPLVLKPSRILSLTVVSISDRVPLFEMPPPKFSPVLSVTVLLVSVRVPAFRMPPAPAPASGLPFWIVTESMKTIAPRMTVSTLSMAPPSMMVVAFPAPSTVKSPVISISPVAFASSPVPPILSVYVPAGRVTMSAPGSALATPIASRKEQSASQTPSLVSVALVTVNVAANAGAAKKNCMSNTPTTASFTKRTFLMCLVPCTATFIINAYVLCHTHLSCGRRTLAQELVGLGSAREPVQEAEAEDSSAQCLPQTPLRSHPRW